MIAAIICIRFIALVVAVTPYGWEKLKANSGHFVSLFVDVVRLVRWKVCAVFFGTSLSSKSGWEGAIGIKFREIREGNEIEWSLLHFAGFHRLIWSIKSQCNFVLGDGCKSTEISTSKRSAETRWRSKVQGPLQWSFIHVSFGAWTTFWLEGQEKSSTSMVTTIVL